MKTTHLMAAAALLTIAAATPALAAWDRIGSVNIDFRSDRDVESMRFGGPVEQLQFRAQRSDIDCRAIRATFENGQTVQLYSGRLRQNVDVNVDLPGAARNVRNLQFNCGADMRSGGTIQIAAEIGRYQNDWRNNPDWDRVWSRMFNWANGMANNMGYNNRPNWNVRWQPLSNVRFQDTNVSFSTAQGRNVQAVALMPLETDARCSRVTITFQNGRSANLNVNNGAVMRRGQTYALDLPGNDRNLRNLRLQCQSEGATAVTVRVLVGR